MWGVVVNNNEEMEPTDLWPRRARRARSTLMQVEDEPSATERAAARRAAQRLFHLVCVACGRSTEPSTTPEPPGRCPHCGGTRLLEVAPS